MAHHWPGWLVIVVVACSSCALVRPAKRGDQARRHSREADRLYAQREWADAASEYSRAIGLEPKYAWARFRRGNCRWRLGKADEAVADYEAAIKIDPSFKSAYFNLGVIHQAASGARDGAERLRRAIFYFDATLKQDARDLGALKALGTIFHGQSDLERALHYYRRYLAINPRDPEVRLWARQLERGRKPPAASGSPRGLPIDPSGERIRKILESRRDSKNAAAKK